MNTVHYANPKTGERKNVPIERAYQYLDERPVSWARKINPRTKRRPTLVEADDAMLKRGFVRWPRKKPVPVQLKAAA